MEMSKVRARINAVENRHHRIVLGFCTVGDEDWDIESLIVKLDNLLPASRAFLSSNLKTVESQYSFSVSDDMRLFVRDTILAANLPSVGFRAAEHEDHWCDSIVDSMVSSHGIMLDYSRLFSNPKSLDAYTRMTFSLMCSLDASEVLLGSEHSRTPGNGVLVSRRLDDVSVIQLVAERPEEWERIASLLINGVHTRTGILAVLDGEVIPALAKGVL